MDEDNVFLMIFIQSLKYRYVHLLSLGSVLLLQDLLDDLLLLNQECTDDSLTHASSAARTTIGTGDVLLTLGDAGILLGPQVGNLRRMVKLVRRSRKGRRGEDAAFRDDVHRGGRHRSRRTWGR